VPSGSRLQTNSLTSTMASETETLEPVEQPAIQLPSPQKEEPAIIDLVDKTEEWLASPHCCLRITSNDSVMSVAAAFNILAAGVYQEDVKRRGIDAYLSITMSKRLFRRYVTLIDPPTLDNTDFYTIGNDVVIGHTDDIARHPNVSACPRFLKFVVIVRDPSKNEYLILLQRGSPFDPDNDELDTIGAHEGQLHADVDLTEAARFIVTDTSIAYMKEGDIFTSRFYVTSTSMRGNETVIRGVYWMDIVCSIDKLTWTELGVEVKHVLCAHYHTPSSGISTAAAAISKTEEAEGEGESIASSSSSTTVPWEFAKPLRPSTFTPFTAPPFYTQEADDEEKEGGVLNLPPPLVFGQPLKPSPFCVPVANRDKETKQEEEEPHRTTTTTPVPAAAAAAAGFSFAAFVPSVHKGKSADLPSQFLLRPNEISVKETLLNSVNNPNKMTPVYSIGTKPRGLLYYYARDTYDAKNGRWDSETKAIVRQWSTGRAMVPLSGMDGDLSEYTVAALRSDSSPSSSLL
jgi:hypothetical protein